MRGLSPLTAIQWRAWATASSCIVKVEVEIVWAALSSWMVVAPGLTVKPTLTSLGETESSVYTMGSCGLRFS